MAAHVMHKNTCGISLLQTTITDKHRTLPSTEVSREAVKRGGLNAPHYVEKALPYIK